MRILIDSILGILACASITVPTFTQAPLEEQIAYAGIAVLLAFLILLLHLKPHDNSEHLINAAKAQNHLSREELNIMK
jgi:hypothetical protein